MRTPSAGRFVLEADVPVKTIGMRGDDPSLGFSQCARVRVSVGFGSAMTCWNQEAGPSPCRAGCRRGSRSRHCQTRGARGRDWANLQACGRSCASRRTGRCPGTRAVPRPRPGLFATSPTHRAPAPMAPSARRSRPAGPEHAGLCARPGSG